MIFILTFLWFLLIIWKTAYERNQAMETPKTYVEFHRDYRPIVCAIARRMNVQLSPDSFEDFVDELINEFVADDNLNPDYGFRDYKYLDKNGIERSAKFLTFLYHFVRNRVYSLRSRQNRRYRMVDIDLCVGDDEDSYHLQLAALPDARAEADFNEVVEQIRESLSQIPVRDGAKRNMLAFFDKVFEQVIEDGFVDKKTLCAHFEISQGSLSLWLQALRRCPVLEKLR